MENSSKLLPFSYPHKPLTDCNKISIFLWFNFRVSKRKKTFSFSSHTHFISSQSSRERKREWLGAVYCDHKKMWQERCNFFLFCWEFRVSLTAVLFTAVLCEKIVNLKLLHATMIIIVVSDVK